MFENSTEFRSVQHVERNYDDFKREPLLPNRHSQLGPGIAWGDVDGDGDQDFWMGQAAVTAGQLLINNGRGSFSDSRQKIFARDAECEDMGAALVDVDNDGWLDIVAVNGHVNRDVGGVRRDGDPFPLGQRNQLLRNVGGRFEDATDRAGSGFDPVEASRGAAFGDVDNDGDTDVLVANGAGPVRLLLNNIGNRQHWLGLRLLGAHGRDMVGARVSISRGTAPVLWRRARADGSYGSANDPRVLVGLESFTDAPRVRVIWPGGQAEEWTGVAIDRYTTLQEGSGSTVRP